MAFADKLKLIAADYAQNQKNRIDELQRELSELETRKSLLSDQLQSARDSTLRFAIYSPRPGLTDDYECPACWIERGEKAALKPLPSDSSIVDFQCSVCRQQYDDA
jgi:hypothetical protein